MNGRNIIKSLRARWVLVKVLTDVLLTLAISLVMDILLHRFAGLSHGWIVLYFVVCSAVLYFIHGGWKMSEKTISRLLDQHYPQLEESSGLLLRTVDSLNLLEKWQYQKTDKALVDISTPLNLFKKIIPSVLLVLLAVCLVAVVQIIPYKKRIEVTSTPETSSAGSRVAERKLPQVASVQVRIKPPSYTGRRSRQQDVFNITAEEGSRVDWMIQTSSAAGHVKLIFNDTLQLTMHAMEAGTRWMADRKMDSTGFYQLTIDGKASELYKLEIIKDNPPAIQIKSPQQYTTIDYGAPQQVKINTAISDDYGVQDAMLVATIASGIGEAIRFKEQKIPLPGFIAGKTQYDIQQTLLLHSLGMQPGDELYFYLQATDNHQQQSRSDIYIVHLPDTAQLMSLEGLANSITLKPEYFRSQRQIIIETEQLLKDRDTISTETFKNKSNNLAIDQKLLRLRYGKFLGEESESGEEHVDEVAGVADFSNAEKLRDAFTDKHDNAEDATFFEPGTKKQLQATLSEMWKAEIHLRTFTPQEALPFEYKALRLLKDLQQQSRVYVAKANFKTTPLDLKKRLTGELTKIDPPVVQKNIQQATDAQAPVRMALSLLQQLTSGKNPKDIPLDILQQANVRLHEKAIQQPAAYLSAVEALKRIINGITTGKQIANTDVKLAGAGLQRLLTVPVQLPTTEKTGAAKALSAQYFLNLQKRQP